MDLATVIGLLLGVGLVGASVSESFSSFIDYPSLLIVIGGGFSATLMSLPLKRVLIAPKVALKSVFSGKDSTGDLIRDMVRYGEIARRDGILALEGVMDEIEDPFLSRGIQLAVDGNDPEDIANTLGQEMNSLSDRHSKGKQVFDLIGKYAPAFGMIGTLIGLILMLANLDDPDQIAPNMAVALLTTLYGALLANMIALPVSDKLSASSEAEVQRMTIIMEGVISIQSGDNPKVVEQKLELFLPPGERSKE
ncbi:MAG: MotA/TolQ/ExbB proton channel family protein [Planctomycetes bacterium]|nr:MotA/TolQ/ExbB proton channel family protein [Planctomycetota bacterium]